MKSKHALLAVTAIVTLSFAGQAVAKGGTMGGSQSHGSTAGTHQAASPMQPVSGHDMQQHTMAGSATQHSPMAGTVPMDMKQGSPRKNMAHQKGPMNTDGAGTTAKHPAVTKSAS